MRFERGIGVKKALGIGMSYDNLQRGAILRIKKSFSTTKWGEINNHTKAYNKFWEGRFIVVRSTPHYEYEGKISFNIRNAYNFDAAERAKKRTLAESEDDYWASRMKIEEMSRLQFDRRFEIVS